MEIQVEQMGSVYQLQIQGDMTIYAALELKSRLQESLNHCLEMEIDLKAVDEMDSSAVQILVLIKREALKAGKKLRLVRHSLAVLDVMEALNLFAYFGDPSIAASKSVGVGA